MGTSPIGTTIDHLAVRRISKSLAAGKDVLWEVADPAARDLLAQYRTQIRAQSGEIKKLKEMV